MLGLSLWPPWGSFMVWGEKRIETRGWRPRVLQPGDWLAIAHTARWPFDWAADLTAAIVDLKTSELAFDADYRAFAEVLQRHDVERLHDVPMGCILGACRYRDSFRSERILANPGEYFTTPNEADLGNYGPGRFGWLFDAAVILPQPLPIKGAQSLWPVPANAEDVIESALKAAGYDIPVSVPRLLL